jgi:thioredoxin reductase (NADPH)
MIYDIAIVGSGPAAYSASIYASRYKLSNIIFGKIVGGTISEAHMVCNYPGLPDITGIELSAKFEKQAKDLGAGIAYESVVDIKKKEGIFHIYTDKDNNQYEAKTVILTTGTERNKLMLPGEDKYLGKGLSYCATCDAMFYKDKTVAVVGGKNAAVMSATMLSDIAKKVYVIYRGTELLGEPMWVDQLMSRKNVEIILKTLPIGLEGENRLERIKLSQPHNGEQHVNVDGAFIEIGSEPDGLFSNMLGLEVDTKKYIKVDQSQATNLEGVWAAGDCTTASNGFRQVVTAVGEGGIAANSIFKYLSQKARA